MRKHFILLVVVVFGLSCDIESLNEQIVSREIQFNLLANPVGMMYLGQLELQGEKSSSIQLIFGGFDYDSWDGSYNEWGSGTVLGAVGRFFYEGQKGPYWGAGLVYIDGGFNWYDSPLYGYGSFSGIAPTFTVGYKSELENKTASVEPNLIFAYLGDDSSAEFIMGAGLTVGFKF